MALGIGQLSRRDTPSPTRERAIVRAPRAALPARSALVQASATQAGPKDDWHNIVRNGYKFRIDTIGRTRHISGSLTVAAPHPRSRAAQTAAGGSDRRPTDDGGHSIAGRFNGPTDAFNHFAQDSNFNRGRYRTLEDMWARAKQEGKKVYVIVTPTYDGSSLRPNAIGVWFTIAGRIHTTSFPNEAKRGSHAKR